MYSDNAQAKLSEAAKTSKRDDNPQDTVQTIKFLPGEKSNIFATGGWDGQLRVYEIKKRYSSFELELIFGISIKEPILCLTWLMKSVILIGCADGNIRAVDLKKEKSEKILKKHNNPVIAAFYHKDENINCLVSFDLGNSIYFWDLEKQKKLGEKELKYRIICVDKSKDMFVVGLDETKLLIFRLEDISKDRQFHYIDCVLFSPISAISLRKDCTEIVVGSADGRISRMELKRTYSGKFEVESKLLFKAHKSDSTTRSRTFHINSICFSNHSDRRASKSFLSCASNDILYVWDYDKKHRSFEMNTEKRNVSCATFNDDGTCIAFALGYDWHRGIWGLADVSETPKVYAYPLKKSELIAR